MKWLDRFLRSSPSKELGSSETGAEMASALAAAQAGDYERALILWEPMARAGNARAQNNIGACFAEGAGVERNPDLAVKWLTSAAEGGDPVAQRNLAALYFKGEGVEPDELRAATLYRSAAGQGDGPAQDMLSWMLLDGAVIERDVAGARRFALAAAAQGVAAAMTRIGMLYHNALGGERDPAEAVRWWRRGAEAGDADGQAMLGAALHLGSGVERDPIEAFVWLTRAARRRQPARGAFHRGRPRIAVRGDLAKRARRAWPPVEGGGENSMIVGTAGHIDHGKTSLVRALTGVDTDRLKEEKARGISIDLGFAYLPVEGGETIGFVDVPGHEKFVHTMVAGASGIDFVLLVIAADDGVMPQTKEHLAIVDLLGIEAGAVALSKANIVPPGRLTDVEAEVRRELSGTSLAEAPVIAVSAATGAGLEALRAQLIDAARRFAWREASGRFRLAVDRSFTFSGAGTIVTGTVLSGSIGVGDHVVVSPSGLPARVRSIHAQNRPSEQGRAGDRSRPQPHR